MIHADPSTSLPLSPGGLTIFLPALWGENPPHLTSPLSSSLLHSESSIPSYITDSNIIVLGSQVADEQHFLFLALAIPVEL